MGPRHPEAFAEVSSSDLAPGSSSFSNDDTRAGSIWPSRPFTPFEPFATFTPFATLAPLVPFAPFTPFRVDTSVTRAEGPAGIGDEAEAEAEASPCVVGSRRVRGRLSFRSGSWAGSAGDAVNERTFLLRPVPLGLSSRARSNAPQARLSSRVSTTGGGGGPAGCRRSLIWGGMLFAKASRAPRRCAISTRCCHRCSSSRSSCWKRRNCPRSSSSS